LISDSKFVLFLKVIKDYQLFLIVAILICIDVATLTTWQIVDPFYRKTAFGTPEVSTSFLTKPVFHPA